MYLIRAKSEIKAVTPRGTHINLSYPKGVTTTNIMRDLINHAGAITPHAEWRNRVTELPAAKNELGRFESIKIIARWEDGKVEPADFHFVSDSPTFQRMCGTDEGMRGWEGDIGKVTHWQPMPEFQPKAQ